MNTKDMIKSQNVTIIEKEHVLDDSDNGVIDNGIMYMDKDRIVYYNQRDESDILSDIQVPGNQHTRPR